MTGEYKPVQLEEYQSRDQTAIDVWKRHREDAWQQYTDSTLNDAELS